MYIVLTEAIGHGVDEDECGELHEHGEGEVEEHVAGEGAHVEQERVLRHDARDPAQHQDEGPKKWAGFENKDSHLRSEFFFSLTIPTH